MRSSGCRLVHGYSIEAKFHYASWFGASSELASVMEFGFKCIICQITNVPANNISTAVHALCSRE